MRYIGLLTLIVLAIGFALVVSEVYTKITSLNRAVKGLRRMIRTKEKEINKLMLDNHNLRMEIKVLERWLSSERIG